MYLTWKAAPNLKEDTLRFAYQAIYYVTNWLHETTRLFLPIMYGAEEIRQKRLSGGTRYFGRSTAIAI